MVVVSGSGFWRDSARNLLVLNTKDDEKWKRLGKFSSREAAMPMNHSAPLWLMNLTKWRHLTWEQSKATKTASRMRRKKKTITFPGFSVKRRKNSLKTIITTSILVYKRRTSTFYSSWLHIWQERSV